MEICPACREFAAAQRVMWSALDTWEAAPVSQDFDRRLYQRISGSFRWDLLVRPFRPLMVRRGCLCCRSLSSGDGRILIDRPAGRRQPPRKTWHRWNRCSRNRWNRHSMRWRC